MKARSREYFRKKYIRKQFNKGRQFDILGMSSIKEKRKGVFIATFNIKFK